MTEEKAPRTDKIMREKILDLLLEDVRALRGELSTGIDRLNTKIEDGLKDMRKYADHRIHEQNEGLRNLIDAQKTEIDALKGKIETLETWVLDVKSKVALIVGVLSLCGGAVSSLATKFFGG